jgi:two-component system, OmpR family, heavy metal sensor histidine kinase CusS
MKPLSFRFKIALLSAVISGLVLLGFGAASWYLLYRQKLASIDTELRALGTRHPGWLANRANFDRFNTSLQFIFGEEQEGRIILMVKDAQAQTLYASPRWPKTIAADSIDCSLEDDKTATEQAAPSAGASDQHGPPWRGTGKGRGGGGRGLGPGYGGGPVVFSKIPRFLTVQTPEGSWRLGIMGNDELRLVVGLNYETVAGDLRRMRNIFLMTLPAALLLVGGGGWWVAGRALRPLKTIAQMAEHVTARGLDQRIPVSDEDPEIGRLIHVLNGMMDRLEASFNQATRFSADASHELKTPLAIMQGELENAVQTAEPGSPEQQVFSNLLEETQRLKTITRGLLLLAQADAGRLKLALEPVDLSVLVETAIEDARILATDASLRFEVNIQPGLRVTADRTLLQMAILNLLGNAVKYNEPGGALGVTLAADGGELLLTLCNSGTGIPLADQPRIFDRFYRVNQSPAADGLGLGLSLAREIAHAHHGELLLKESRPGYTCFTLSLPRLLQ